jgi:hypothetical protein
MLPLLLGLGGSAMAGAGMLGSLGALGAGALGSGLGSFIETGDLGKGIATGLTSYFGGKMLGSAFGGGADMSNLAPGATPGSVLPTSAADAAQLASSTPALGGQGSGAYLRTGLNSSGSFVPQAAPVAPASSSGFNFGDMFKDTTSGIGSSIPADATIGQRFTGAQNALMTPESISAAGTTALSDPSTAQALGLMPKPYEKPKAPDIPESDVPEDNIRFPGSDYRPGQSPEFDYGFSMSRSGGLMSLKEGGETSEGEISGLNDKEIISKAVDAIQGVSDSPQEDLGIFLAKFGEGALRDLVDRVSSGELGDTAARSEGAVRGPGDGMSDMIPATLEGEQDVVLSDGEFIVPADVVSGLGNGSSDAGSKALYEMMDRVRKMRTGTTEQPDGVPLTEMMPV